MDKCSKCGGIKTQTRRSKYDHLCSECKKEVKKELSKQYFKEWYSKKKKDKEWIKKRDKRAKVYYAKNKEYYSVYNKQWSKENPDKIKEYTKRNYEKNKEYYKTYSKKYYEQNKEHLKKLNKRWVNKNKEHLREYGKKRYKENKERIKKAQKKYYENNKHVYRKNTALYFAHKKGNTPTFILECPIENERVKNIYRLRDVMTTATGVQHHVDHMWPLADGGPHWSGNLQIIPAEDNIKKSDIVDPAIKAAIQEMLDEEVRLHED